MAKLPKPYLQWIANHRKNGDRLAEALKELLDVLSEYERSFTISDDVIKNARDALKKHNKLTNLKLTDMGNPID